MAIRKIKIKRGLEADLPTLDIGEPGFTTDTKRFFIGSATGNIEYPSLTAIQALIDNIDITDLEGLATEEYVDNAIAAIPTTDLTGLATEEYVNNAIAAIGESLPPYRGFKAHYGKLYGDDPSINRLVIYKETVENPTSSVDTSTEDDLFVVEGLSGTDFVALVNLYGSSSSAPISNAVLMAFLEVFVDNIILNEDGDLNSIEQMKESFYGKFEMLASSLPEGTLTGNFEFFEGDFLITPNLTEVNQGSGLEVELYYNFEDNFWDGYDIYASGSGYQVNDEITISGTYFLNGSSPENDITLTITEIGGNGEVTSFTTSGVPLAVFPTNNIDDGGDDQYDGGNYISTNLTVMDQDSDYTGISYNNGNIVNDSPDFGGEGASYVVTYQDSIFALFATNIDIESIKTDGNSGTDGDGTALTGSLFDPSAPGFGDFEVSGLTITGSDEVTITNESSDEDMRIRAGDDLYLEAYGDDIVIRSADDVKIQTNYDFSESEYGSEWEFASDGTTYLAKNSSTNDTYLSTPSNNTEVSLEITAGRDIYLRTGGYDNDGQGGNTSVTFKFDDEGNITLPSGGDILDSSGNSLLGGSVDLTDYATEDYVDNAINGISIPSISGLATEGYVDDAISAIDIPDIGAITFENNDIIGNIIGQEGIIVSASTSSTGTTSVNSNALFLSSSIPNIDSVAIGWTVTFAGNITKTVVGITDISSEVKQIQFNGNSFVYNYPITITSPDYVAGSDPEVNIIAGENQWKFDDSGAITFPDGSTQTTALKNGTGEWTLATGSNTVSFTVDDNNTYSMWVRGNIPNGIIVWNATVTITNINVPVIGTQYAWNYNSGEIGSPVFVLELSSMPAQIIGTPGAISTSLPSVGTTTNKFEFTINNASGSAQTIQYGWTKI
jgi:hypothetical protein